MYRLAKALIIPLFFLNIVILFFVFSLNIGSMRLCFLKFENPLLDLPDFLRILFGAIGLYMLSFLLIMYALLSEHKVRAVFILLFNLILIFVSTQVLFHYFLPGACLMR